MKVLKRLVKYSMYYDYDNDWVRFEPDGFNTYPNTLTVGSNVYNVPFWKENINAMRNKIYVDGDDTGFTTPHNISNISIGAAFRPNHKLCDNI